MKNLLISLLVVTSFLQISCSPDVVKNTPATNPVDVYVAGQKNSHACYWKNNQLFTLQDDGAFNSSADTLMVKNNVVHITGTSLINGNYDTVYWKNGELTNLTQTFSTPDQIVKTITGMDVVGDDVYFVGYTKNPLITTEIYDLVYWKNGIKTVVNKNVNRIYSSNIKVFNNDIYITASNSPNFLLNGYYKNNVFYEIPNSFLIDFAVNNNEIYTFGSYLLSNKIHNITTNTDLNVGFANDAPITSLNFDNNNMYYTNGTQIYKNGTLYYQTQTNSYHYISNFKIFKDNRYTIENHLNYSTININDTISLTSLPGEYFHYLYIVQK